MDTTIQITCSIALVSSLVSLPLSILNAYCFHLSEQRAKEIALQIGAKRVDALLSIMDKRVANAIAVLFLNLIVNVLYAGLICAGAIIFELGITMPQMIALYVMVIGVALIFHAYAICNPWILESLIKRTFKSVSSPNKLI